MGYFKRLFVLAIIVNLILVALPSHVLAAPAVAVTSDGAMTPFTVEETVTVNVDVSASDAADLTELDSVILKVWYDANGGTPLQSEFDSASGAPATAAIMSWTPGGGFAAIDAGGSTTWSLGTCTAPALGGTSGNFEFKFTPGKVATETVDSDRWQVAATATDTSGTTFNYGTGCTMAWYGQVVLASPNIDWGTVPAGLSYDDSDPSREALGSTLYVIANGAYNLTVGTSSASWSGGATLVNDTPDAADEFGILVDIDNTMADAKTLSTTPATLDSGTLTSETGDTYATINLWLQLYSIFTTGVHSGTIDFVVENG